MGLTVTNGRGIDFAGLLPKAPGNMGREFAFNPELLRMMLSEERQKFCSALSEGASWRELNRIRKTISQLNELIDSSENSASPRTSNPPRAERE